MLFKANLHFHCKEDPSDCVPYTFKEGMDYFSQHGFEVVALTLHNFFGYTIERAAYAAEKNILLIPGIEKTIQGKHVVLLNCDKSAEAIETFKHLKDYRETHPDVFILAPHPYLFILSLQESLEEHINLFDAIEQSWYYSKKIDWNKRASETAKRYHKPFIATSDTHTLRFIDRSYAVIDAKKKLATHVLDAIRNNQFENHSKPSHLLRDMICTQCFLSGRDAFWKCVNALKTGVKQKLPRP